MKRDSLFIKGEVAFTPERRQALMFDPVDQFTFPAGINLKWEVQQAVRKHFIFDD